MKKIFVVFLTFLVNTAQSEIARDGLIYNQKSCAFYNAGDECTHYIVPTGWKELYPESKCKDKLKKQFCYKLKNKTCRGSAKKCCEDFGFEFVKIKLEPVINTNLDECKARK